MLKNSDCGRRIAAIIMFSMAADRQTLLAKLQPMFKNRTENVAVAALEHILSRSDAARRAPSDMPDMRARSIHGMRTP